jgi:hypothetical protein
MVSGVGCACLLSDLALSEVKLFGASQSSLRGFFVVAARHESVKGFAHDLFSQVILDLRLPNSDGLLRN